MVRSAILILLMSSAASADDRLARMEAIGEEMSQLMYRVMVDEIAANGADVSTLRSMIPETRWGQPMRDAAGCVLDAYEKRVGAAEVDEMLDSMEALLPKLRQSSSMEVFSEQSGMQPEGISDDEMISISQSCGMLEVIQNNTRASEFMAEVRKLMSGN